MIKIQPVHLKKWLLPFSWMYRFVVYIRNKFFDWGILKTEQFDIPIICVGNITAGGTGKTPHVEYLVRILKDKYKVAVLSRGYKRKTKGFILATNKATSIDIGDESLQIKQKFQDIIVAVDANRSRGIKKLLALDNPPQVIILDDAFQHRYVKPSYSIVLSNFNRPIYEDSLLPVGMLREPLKSLNRANMIIVTKCPADLQPIDYRIISRDINPFPYQNLYFSTLTYKYIVKVFDRKKEYTLDLLTHKHVLLVTGIASPKMILEKLSEYTDLVETITYSDHYNFKRKDIKHIKDKFDNIQSPDKIILMTEKDATRFLFRTDIDDVLKENMYCLPVEIFFIDESERNNFEKKILEHVRENKANRRIHKK